MAMIRAGGSSVRNVGRIKVDLQKIMNMIVAAQCHGASNTGVPAGGEQTFPSQFPSIQKND